MLPRSAKTLCGAETQVIGNFLTHLLRIGSCETWLEYGLRSTKALRGLCCAAECLGRLNSAKSCGAVSKAAFLGDVLTHLLRIGAREAWLEYSLHATETLLCKLRSPKTCRARAKTSCTAAAKLQVIGNFLAYLLRIGSGKARLEYSLRAAEALCGLRCAKSCRTAAKPQVAGDVLAHLLRIGSRKARLEHRLRSAKSLRGLCCTKSSCTAAKPQVTGDVLTHLLRIGSGEARLEYGLHATESLLCKLRSYITCRTRAKTTFIGNALAHLLRIGARKAWLKHGLNGW